MCIRDRSIATATVSENFVKPADQVSNESICELDLPFVFNGQSITEAVTGFRIENGPCDADFVLNLSVTPVGQDVVTPATVCELDLPFVFGGQSFTQSGSFVISTGACGGSEILNLTVTPAGQDVVTPATVCELDLPFVFGGQSFTQSGSFVISTGACGGSEILNLTVTPAGQDVVTPATVCELDLPFVFGGQSFTQSGSFVISTGALSLIHISEPTRPY